MNTQRPIGVFDSGVGGLSILQALRAELPAERFVYLADSGHAPYGERDDTHVIARAQAITAHLLAAHRIKMLVVACNTATAAAIHLLRAQHPSLPIIGVEPAVKPAMQLSRTRRVGVMATRGTLQSAKFRTLLASLKGDTEFVLQACDGLADAIERQDSARIEALSRSHTQAMGRFGSASGEIDTVVLGCTHYPFAGDTLRELLGPQVRLMESGAPVARQARRLLPNPAAGDTALPTHLYTSTGHTAQLLAMAGRWVEPEVDVSLLHI